MLIAALAAALTLVSVPPPTPADRPLVVIVLPKSPTAGEASSVEASIRLRGELDSAGVEVRTIDSLDTPSTPEDLERIARENHAVAAIALVWVPGMETTDLWIADRMTGNFVHKRVDATGTGEKSVELLAIRTAELIRASLVDLFVAPPPPPPPVVTAPPPPPPAPPPKPRRVHLRVAAGPTLMLVRGAPPSVAPILDAGVLIDQKWLVRAVAAGLGTTSKLGDSSNGADVHQSTAVAQIQYRRRLGWRLTGAADLGAGVLHVSNSGHATLPYEAASVSRTSFCGVGGLALNVTLWTKLEVSLEGQALLAAPATDAWAANYGPAKTGQPTVLVALGLAVIP